MLPGPKKKDFNQLKYPGLAVFAVVIIAMIWWPKGNRFNKFRSMDLVPSGEILYPSPQASPALAGPNRKTDLVTELQASVAALLARVEYLESNQAASPAPLASSNPAASTANSFAPQSLYLGSGSTTSREWVETQAQIELNDADYPSAVIATFEASLSIVGGEAYARLKNKTTGAIISISEVMHNNNIPSTKASAGFKLHQGKNLYIVEIKSSSGETANLTGARLKLSL